jgi:hypothetical protein
MSHIVFRTTDQLGDDITYLLCIKEMSREILQRKGFFLSSQKSCRLLGVMTKCNHIISVSLRLLPYASLSFFSVMYLRGSTRKVLVYYGEVSQYQAVNFPLWIKPCVILPCTYKAVLKDGSHVTLWQFPIRNTLIGTIQNTEGNIFHKKSG